MFRPSSVSRKPPRPQRDPREPRLRQILLGSILLIEVGDGLRSIGRQDAREHEARHARALGGIDEVAVALVIDGAQGVSRLPAPVAVSRRQQRARVPEGSQRALDTGAILEIADKSPGTRLAQGVSGWFGTHEHAHGVVLVQKEPCGFAAYQTASTDHKNFHTLLGILNLRNIKHRT
jgi:hypothetical protein